MIADSGGLSWRESAEERERGSTLVFITGFGPKGQPEAVARLVARQKEVTDEEAAAEIDALAQGMPIECRFFDTGKARLFAVVCRVKGAICDIQE